MDQTRLFQFYSCFSSKQVREFADFVRSPFFNKRTQLITLAEYLEQSQKSTKTKFTKELAYKKMYPKEAYDDQKMRLAMSNLLKLMEQFVAHRSFAEDTFEKKLRVLHFCREANLPKYFDYLLTGLQKWQNKRPERNAEYFDTQVKLMQETFLHQSAGQRTAYDLQVVSDTLDLAFLSHKLRQTCQLFNIRSVLKMEFDSGMLEEVLTYIEKKNLQEEPAIAVYLQAYHFLPQSDNEVAFQNFKTLLFQNEQRFPKWEARDLYLLALNFCIRQGNNGKQAFFSQALDFYKTGLEKGYLLQNGQLSRFTYINAVMISLKIADYQSAESFIYQYEKLLNRKDRESTFSYCLVELEYARGNYDAALPLLQKVDYKDLLLSLNAKTILLKIYYELDEYDLLHAHLDAMRIFLRRKKVLGYHRTNYENIIQYAQKLITINPNNKSAMQNLKAKIQAEEILTAREWFLEQVSGFQ